MLAEELFYRAGGLVKVYPILDEPLMLHKNASRSSQVERLSGYGATAFLPQEKTQPSFSPTPAEMRCQWKWLWK